MLVYLSGPMTGHPNNNAVAFDAAQAWLEDGGHYVVSPVDVERRAGRDMSQEATPEEYEGFMARDLDVIALLPTFAHAVGTEPGVVLLEGWWDSGGAGREGLRALEAGVPLYRLFSAAEYDDVVDLEHGERWLDEMSEHVFRALCTTTRRRDHVGA